MKKILAIVLSVLMIFSVAAFSASAAEATESNGVFSSVTNDANEVVESAKDIYNGVAEKNFEATIDGIIAFAENLADAIHSIVHTAAELFFFDCPFCEDAVVEA